MALEFFYEDVSLEDIARIWSYNQGDYPLFKRGGSFPKIVDANGLFVCPVEEVSEGVYNAIFDDLEVEFTVLDRKIVPFSLFVQMGQFAGLSNDLYFQESRNQPYTLTEEWNVTSGPFANNLYTGPFSNQFDLLIRKPDEAQTNTFLTLRLVFYAEHFRSQKEVLDPVLNVTGYIPKIVSFGRFTFPLRVVD